MTIQSFGDEATQDFFHGRSTARARKIPQNIREAALRKLDRVNQAASLSDLEVPPGNRLEPLKGDRHGYHSIRINDQWRITFKWTEAGPAEVSIEDYH